MEMKHAQGGSHDQPTYLFHRLGLGTRGFDETEDGEGLGEEGKEEGSGGRGGRGSFAVGRGGHASRELWLLLRLLEVHLLLLLLWWRRWQTCVHLCGVIESAEDLLSLNVDLLCPPLRSRRC